MSTQAAPIILESYSLRNRLQTYVLSGAFGREVLDHLLPGGNPHCCSNMILSP